MTARVKYGFHVTDFHNTRNRSTTLCADTVFPYILSPKSVKKYVKYGWKFIYDLR